jgi:hypothetical protein
MRDAKKAMKKLLAFKPEAAKMISQKTADQRRQTEKKLIAFRLKPR